MKDWASVGIDILMIFWLGIWIQLFSSQKILFCKEDLFISSFSAGKNYSIIFHWGRYGQFCPSMGLWEAGVLNLLGTFFPFEKILPVQEVDGPWSIFFYELYGRGFHILLFTAQISSGYFQSLNAFQVMMFSIVFKLKCHILSPLAERFSPGLWEGVVTVVVSIPIKQFQFFFPQWRDKCHRRSRLF